MQYAMFFTYSDMVLRPSFTQILRRFFSMHRSNYIGNFIRRIFSVYLDLGIQNVIYRQKSIDSCGCVEIQGAQIRFGIVSIHGKIFVSNILQNTLNISFSFFFFFFCDIIEALKLKSTDKCIKMGTLDHFKYNFSDNNLILLFLLHYIYPITYYILILLQKIIFPIFYVSLYFIILSIYFEFQSRKNLIDSD